MRSSLRGSESCGLPLLLAAVLAMTLAGSLGATECTEDNTITANVVALDQPIHYNRLGGKLKTGQIYALERDVCPQTGTNDPCDTSNAQDHKESLLSAWNSDPTKTSVTLRPGKRPRPMVLRVNQDQCLEINFTNLLTQDAKNVSGLHIQGMEWVKNDQDDGSWVGQNTSSLVNPGASTTYKLIARKEGTFLLYSVAGSAAGTFGGQQTNGLFGALNVQPRHAEWYRSQVTENDLQQATTGHTEAHQPVLDYDKVYESGPRTGTPILAMLCDGSYADACAKNELAHTDLTAVITGPGRGNFSPKERLSSYALPSREQPYREFTIHYHEIFGGSQAFPKVYGKALNVDGTGQDQFGINYGLAGIGSEILANRFEVGPMADCTGCKYEEFFLSSWAVGDPAMVVDQAATENTTLAGFCSDDGASCDASTQKGCNSGATCLVQYSRSQDATPATKAYFPDDPSNVYHSYIRDHTVFRILHGGIDLHHLHHQHAHQWLHSPNSPSGDYLDSQSIGPGSSFTLEMVYNGSGNVNQTVGDSIFHCHFYPHFAMGMWSLWRVHDVYEAGTQMNDDGTVASGINRALPDGEIETGTPIPAVVPLPTRALPPWPAPVRLANNGRTIEICAADDPNNCVSNLAADLPEGDFRNPGYPFYIPGLGGQRAPHPPMDFARADPNDPHSEALDGGLPRHLLGPCQRDQNGNIEPGCVDSAAFLAPNGTPTVPFFDFSKTLLETKAFELPEMGTGAEKLAMGTHARRFHPTCEGANCAPCLAGGDCDQACRDTGSGPSPECSPAFILNGLPPTQGAPYADPCINYSLSGGHPDDLRTDRYLAADIQLDAVFNKEGWHFPQLRMISLWGDVKSTLAGEREPEPLFFRVNSGDCIDYTLANLVPSVYELDDFQVRTPTDILGQHIHLVKFDVTSSDGAANGFNYEDGTFSPDEVMERINAINRAGGLAPAYNAVPEKMSKAKAGYDQETGFPLLSPKPLPYFGSGPGGRWMGAQATVQRFYADPLFDGRSHDPPSPGAKDRTMRTVFTHDHFSPSTHQQAGLYAGLVIEPRGSEWFENDGGAPMGDRFDGGPTSWQAVIETPDKEDSYREFALLFQDTTLTYLPFGDLKYDVDKGGFCSDNSAACKPATNVTPADTSSCEYPRTAVCFAYGFCSTDPNTPCKPGTWTAVADVEGCPNSDMASCNLVAGIPGQAVVGYPLINAAPPYVHSGLPVWDTVPVDPPGKSGPEIISLSGGTYSFSTNYRNEPLYPRISSGSAPANDLSYAYSSRVHDDPFTGIMHAYVGDDVQIRTLVGAHINPHNFTVQGVKWLMEPSMVDSGWRASQVMGISEHFEELFQLPPWFDEETGVADYVYMPGAAAIEQQSGSWGLMRAIGSIQDGLPALPQNQAPGASKDFPVCPEGAPERSYTVVAMQTSLTYNSRFGITDPTGLIYVDAARMYQPSKTCTDEHANDPACACGTPTTSCQLKPGYQTEPLVLRAAAGDCVKVKLYNFLSETPLAGAASPSLPPNTWTAENAPFAANACGVTTSSGAKAPPCQPSNTSSTVGLRPQLVTYDITKSSGFAAGLNPPRVVPAGGDPVIYTWFAGNIDVKTHQHIPTELGGANLLPSDVINHFQHGLFGALVVEPLRSSWSFPDETTAISAIVTKEDGSRFREHVLITQDGIQLKNGTTVTPSLQTPNATALNAVNYKSEPLTQRTCSDPSTAVADCLFANDAICGKDSAGNPRTCGEPETPIFQACPGEEVRFRLLHPGGVNTNEVFELFGHVWAETPYESADEGCESPTTQTNPYASSVIGTRLNCLDKPSPNETEWTGSRMGHGPGNHYEVVIPSAGGVNKVAGDYLYKTSSDMHVNPGLWGLFRVLPTSDSMCSSGY